MTFDNSKRIRKIEETAGSIMIDEILDKYIAKGETEQYEKSCIDLADCMMKTSVPRKKK